MGLLKVKEYVNKKDVEEYSLYIHIYNSDLKTLKSDFMLLYNTLPISYTSTPERIFLLLF